MSLRIRRYKTLHGNQLQSWFTLEIEEHELNPEDWHCVTGTSVIAKSNKVVYMCSTIHVNKRVKLNPMFCGTISDMEILRDSDLLKSIGNHYGRSAGDVFAN